MSETVERRGEERRGCRGSGQWAVGCEMGIMGTGWGSVSPTQNGTLCNTKRRTPPIDRMIPNTSPRSDNRSATVDSLTIGLYASLRLPIASLFTAHHLRHRFHRKRARLSVRPRFDVIGNQQPASVFADSRFEGQSTPQVVLDGIRHVEPG